MRFVPYYRVSYHGKYYRAGIEFDIDECDEEAMGKQGRIVGGGPPKKVEPARAVSSTVTSVKAEKPVRKAGRPRKQP